MEYQEKKLKRMLNKIHKLKRENLVFASKRNGILSKGIITTNDIKTMFNLSEHIGKNGLKISHLRTKIAHIKIEILRKEVV